MHSIQSRLIIWEGDDMGIFNQKSVSYDKWYQSHKGAFIDEIETELIFSMLNVKDGMRILDAGCGTGNFSIKLAEKGAAVTAIDISKNMMAVAEQKARQHLDAKIDFRQMDIKKLEFADNTFDAILSVATFGFIDKPQEAYAELYRVLKPGGQLLIATICRDSHWGEFYYRKSQTDSNSVFRFAELKTCKELENLDKDNLLDSKECLFIPPTAKEAEFNWAEEVRRAEREKGGFSCVLFGKKK